MLLATLFRGGSAHFPPGPRAASLASEPRLHYLARPMTLSFLVFATEWRSGHGGLSTFNRHLCLALARAGCHVTCIVADGTSEDVADASDHLVDLRVPAETPGLRREAAHNILLMGLSGQREFDVVAGHGRVTGPHALAIRNRDYPNARYAHFIHMDAKSIDWEKARQRPENPSETATERIDVETQLSLQAAIAMAVGPLLTTRFATYLHESGQVVHEFRPGLFDCTQLATTPAAHDCLVFGRVDDYRLKGVDLAAKALGAVMRTGAFRQSRFIVLGARRGEDVALRDQILEESGHLNVDVEQYTSDAAKVLRAIRRATLVLMPSRSEGFGLAALEAISQGVPVLVSTASGLADALALTIPEVARQHVVDVRSHEEFERAIRRVLDDPEEAFRNAQRLRRAMLEHFSWDKSTATFLGLLKDSSSAPAAGASPRSSGADPIANLVAAMGSASRGLEQWPQKLSSGEWLERPELAMLAAQLTEPDSRRFWLLGGAGSGKSALMARLVDTLKAKDVAVLAIKTDQIPHDVDGAAKLSEWLRLSPSAIDVVGSVARARRVVVILDQLDALADIVDQKTQRLGAVLAFARSISGFDNVSVVASCRPFDFNRDIRFRELAYEEMRLQDPTAEAIEAILGDRGVASASPKLRQLLAAPHWLNVFLRLRRGGGSLDFESEHALLEALWVQAVGVGAENSDSEATLVEMAVEMAESEELWVPVARFPARASALAHLEHNSIIRRDPSGSRVAFAHQTFFEFVRARAFVAEGVSLTGYIKDKAYSLFTRPILWSALSYIRAAHPTKYRRDLGELLGDTGMRPHLIALLFQFLGEQPKPALAEQRSLLAAIDDPKRHMLTIKAVMGKKAWFSVIEPRLPSLMLARPSSTGLVLEAALGFAERKVLRLLRIYWLPLPDRREAIAWMLLRAKIWSKGLAELALDLVRSRSLNARTTSVLLGHAAKGSPAVAATMIGIELRSLLEERRRSLVPQTPLAEDASVEEHVAWHFDREPRRTLGRLLDEASGLYGLVELAKRAPDAFLNEVWPWYVEIVDQCTDTNDETGLIFRRDYLHQTDVDSPNEFGAIVASAARNLAKTDLTAFKGFLHSGSVVTLEALHQVLIAGLVSGLPRTSSLAIKYLLSDRRGLTVGSAGNGFASEELLRALAPTLGAADVTKLISAIELSRIYEEADPNRDARSRRAAREANERHRRALLQALEQAQLPSHVRARVAAAAVDDDVRPGRVVGGVIGSHVSVEQISKMRDEHILGLFATLPDTTEFQHPKRLLSGGSIQAARNFEEAIKKHPERHERYAALLKRFSPGTQQRPVAHGFSALADSEYGLARAERLLAELEDLGFTSEEFRTSAAYALEKLANAELKASDETISRLEDWLRDAETIEPVPERQSAEKSILWGWGGGGILPRGNYPALSVLTVLLLVRPAPRFDDWTKLLLRHLERRESPRVWAMLLRRLRNVRYADDNRGELFLVKLFERFPEVRDSPEGVRLIVWCSGWISPRVVEQWMFAVRESDWSLAAHAFGEVAAVIGTAETAPEWALRTLEAALSDAGDAEIRRGVTRVAPRIWNDMSRRERATQIIVRACELASSEETYNDVMSVFDVADEFIVDHHTTQVLDAMLSHPAVLSGRTVHFADRLSVLLSTVPKTVCALASAFVAERIRPGDVSGDLFSTGPKLVDISLTLQRLGDAEIRAKGLDLFEQLLEAEAYGARDVLTELDAGNRRTDDILYPE